MGQSITITPEEVMDGATAAHRIRLLPEGSAVVVEVAAADAPVAVAGLAEAEAVQVGDALVAAVGVAAR